MTSELKNIISKIYYAFEKYHGEKSMTGSPIYANLPEWNKEIFSKPLKDLTEGDLSRFVGKSMSTWGNSTDFKHFLPRILELTAEFKTPYELWILFDKLRLAEWKNWNKSEQILIEEYIIELWRELLNNNSKKAKWVFKDYFSTIAHNYPNFTELLSIWYKQDSKSSIYHLSNYLIEEHSEIFEGNYISGFYDKTENIEEFQNWLLSEQIIERLQEKYFEYENEHFTDKISLAEQILTTEKSNTKNKLL